MAEDRPITEDEWAPGPDEDSSDQDDVWAEDGDEIVPADVQPETEAAPDPWVRVLLVAVLSLVVVLLVTTGAFYFYMSALNRAPRTLVEGDIASAEKAIQETPKSVDSWTQLAYAYASAKRWDDALDAASKGMKLPKSETLSTVRADVLRFAGRTKQAVAAYDVAERKMKERAKRLKVERAKLNINIEIKDDALFRVYWGRGLAKRTLGDDTGAIKDLESAAKEDARQTDVWVSLGDLYAKRGQTDKARSAYKQALVYIPDLATAKTGLKRLGEGK